MSDSGFNVLEGANGERGLALLDQIRPAAAVIDFAIPGMNGAEVARLAQARRLGLPIVFVSGCSETVALDGIAGVVVMCKSFDVNGPSSVINALVHCR